MKNRTPVIPLSSIVVLLLLNAFPMNAQVQLGIRKMNVFGQISYSSPTNELKNYYSLGDLMKFYIGAELPFLAANYGKNTTTGFSIAALVDHEKANFESGDYSTDGMDVKMTSFGFRIRPFANMAVYAPKGKIVNGNYVIITTHKGSGIDEHGNSIPTEYTTTQTLPIWSDEGAKLIVTMLLSGMYFDYGKSNMTFIEPPYSTVHRNATMYSYGCSPTIGAAKKINMYVDVGIRQYKWINSMGTTSGIKTWHIGFGIGFNLK